MSPRYMEKEWTGRGHDPVLSRSLGARPTQEAEGIGPGKDPTRPSAPGAQTLGQGLRTQRLRDGEGGILLPLAPIAPQGYWRKTGHCEGSRGPHRDSCAMPGHWATRDSSIPCTSHPTFSFDPHPWCVIISRYRGETEADPCPTASQSCSAGQQHPTRSSLVPPLHSPAVGEPFTLSVSQSHYP